MISYAYICNVHVQIIEITVNRQTCDEFTVQILYEFELEVFFDLFYETPMSLVKAKCSELPKTSE